MQDIIMTSVPQASHVKKVFLDPEHGLLAAETAPEKQRVFLELSTIDAGVSAEIAQQVVSKGHGLFVDAPCSVSNSQRPHRDAYGFNTDLVSSQGGAMGAESGALSFMVGCPTELFPIVFAICKLMGKEEGIFHCGVVSKPSFSTTTCHHSQHWQRQRP
jgi:3-hydroxyisobutyrate dehydrogenase-like beta-hydroxyacid dehydrogenase